MLKQRKFHLEIPFIAVLALALYFPAGNAQAVTACDPEPTNMSVAYGELITCDITPGTDTDLYHFSGNAGDRILAEALFVSGISFNPRIQLIAPDGATLGNTFSPARLDIVLAQTGTYTVIISDDFSNVSGEYSFSVSCLSGSCLPVAPPPPAPPLADNLVCEPEPTDMFTQYSQRVACDITPGTDTDLYRFSGDSGDRVLAEAVFVSGTSFNPRLQLIAPDGTTLGNTFSPGRIDAVLPETGTYTARVSDDFNNVSGEYAYTVSCLAGSCSPQPAVPTLDLSLIGCTVCQIGDQFTVEAHATNPTTSDISIEVKIGIRLPDGSTMNMLGDNHIEAVLPAGFDTVITPIDVPVTSDFSNGILTVEGILLGPDLGDTFYRDVIEFEVLQ